MACSALEIGERLERLRKVEERTLVPEASDQRLENRPGLIEVAEVHELVSKLDCALGRLPGAEFDAATSSPAHLNHVVLEHRLPGLRGQRVQVIVGFLGERDDTVHERAPASDVVLLRCVIPNLEEQLRGASRVVNGDPFGFITAGIEPVGDLAAGTSNLRTALNHVCAQEQAGGERERLIEERSGVVRAARVVSGAACLMQPLGAPLNVGRQPSGAFEETRLRLRAAAAARAFGDSRELRGNLLIVSNCGQRAMPNGAIRIDWRERVGKRRVDIPLFPGARRRNHCRAHQWMPKS